MKKVLIVTVILLSAYFNTQAQNIPESEIVVAANSWLLNMPESQQAVINNFHEIFNKEKIVAYQFNLSPSGFVIFTNNKSLTPVIAYSFRNKFTDKGPLKDIIIKDIKLRMENLPYLSISIKEKNIDRWDKLLAQVKRTMAFEQWPESGTTSTGGWVETEWSQSSPYNDFCPLDLVSGQRSIAGCPSVAISMIINYINTINGTRFTDDDKYYHNYGGNSYWIDDDYLTYDFAPFSKINSYFDSIEKQYSNNEPLNNKEMATLVFACGVAAEQVYASGGSGTFGVDQAYDSFVRFGFDNANLIYDTDTSFYTQMKNNIKSAMPLLLALIVNGGPGGHNVVADGYNSDDFYHLNFGWGGSYNSWYNIPEGIPYNLTIVEGAVVDIGAKQVGIDKTLSPVAISVSPNPSNELINIKVDFNKDKVASLFIIDNMGRKIYDFIDNEGYSGIKTFKWRANNTGVYHVVLIQGNKRNSTKIVIN